MGTYHQWLYEHAPNWTSSQWEWAVLAIGVFGLVYRFVAARTKNTVDDRLGVVVDIAEAEARNLRNRARAKEQQK